METPRHIANMQKFEQNEDAYIDKYSDEFEKGMLDVIKA